MSDLNEHVVCYLTTTGRVTGRLHEIEIWFAGDRQTIYFLSGGRDRSDWVRNIMANGDATVRINGETFVGRGRVVEEAEEQTTARHLVYEKYQPRKENDLTEWRERSLPLAVDLL